VGERDELLALLERTRADQAAGDLDDGDAEALIDDYTARIAGLTRAIDGDEASGAGKQGDTPADAAAGKPGAAPSALNRRTLMWVAVVVAFALLAGILVVQSAGRRGAGETFTGDIRQTTRDLLLGARDQIAVGEFDEALATYDEVLAIAPANVEALTYSAWVGRTMARSIDDDTALALLDDAVAIDPQYPDARVFQAIILRDLGRFSEAQVALDGLGDDDIPDFLVMQVEALRLEVSGADPDRIDIVRAEAAARTGDFAQALRLLDAVIERSPDNVEAIIAKVDVLLVVSSAASGDDRVLLLTNAGQLVDRAQAIDPDDPAPVLYEALVLELQGQTAEALAVLDSLEARDGLDPAVVAEIGALRSRLGG
jgi:tetratricopeptide (TPR) repeat protein